MSEGRTFGQAVREARLAKGLSMGQLAAAVERSTASVRRWERDEGLPAEAVVEKLTNVLNLDSGPFDLPDVAPEIERVPIVKEPPPDATRPTAASASGFVTQTGLQAVTRRGLMAEIRDPSKPWLGYIRATLTTVVLLLLAWVLLWAVGNLVGSVGEIWESLWAETA
ncbi:MAG: helix-turn-helix transcriptional regulator [Actinomycetota bacterium]